jgi:hypothetical protein
MRNGEEPNIHREGRPLESRFGPLPEELRLRIEGIDSVEELTELSLRAGAASSVTALGLR